MTLKELEAWITRKKEIAALSGQVIDDYIVRAYNDTVVGGSVDHGGDTIYLWGGG